MSPAFSSSPSSASSSPASWAGLRSLDKIHES
jgi:hypothetical protein